MCPIIAPWEGVTSDSPSTGWEGRGQEPPDYLKISARFSEVPGRAPGFHRNFLTPVEETLSENLLDAGSQPGAFAGTVSCTPANGSGREV